MSMGYPAAQGYTGLPATPTRSSGGYGSMFGPISSGLSLASSVLGAGQSFRASGSYKDQAKEYTLRAAQVMEQGFQTAIDLRREGEEVAGAMTAAYGKSGSLLSGSPLLVLADTADRVNRNVDRVMEQARSEARSYYLASKKAKKAAKSAKREGIAQIVAGVGAAAALFVGGPFALAGMLAGGAISLSAKE